MVDKTEKSAKIFELISVSDEPIRLLFSETIRQCQEEFGVEYVDAGVSKFIVRPVGGDEATVLHQTERLINEVLPKVEARFGGDV